MAGRARGDRQAPIGRSGRTKLEKLGPAFSVFRFPVVQRNKKLPSDWCVVTTGLPSCRSRCRTARQGSWRPPSCRDPACLGLQYQPGFPDDVPRHGAARLVHYFSVIGCRPRDRVATRARSGSPPLRADGGQSASRSARFLEASSVVGTRRTRSVTIRRGIAIDSGAPANVRGGLHGHGPRAAQEVRGRRPGRVRLEPNARRR